MPADGSRIAVTGATGFVGRAVVARLAAEGLPSAALSRRQPPGASGGVQVARYDDAGELVPHFEGCGAVIHLAAVAHEPASGAAGRSAATFAPNAAAARAVAEACARAGVRRLVLVSSIGVHGARTLGRPFTEADPPRPVEPYAVSKLQCEQVAADVAARHGVELAIVRPPLVHGAHAPGNFGALWRAVARRRPLPVGAIDNQRSLVGVDNLADLLLRCATDPRAAGEVFLAADGEDVSTPELVRRIAAAQGHQARLWSVPLPLLRLAGTVARRRAAVERLTWSLQVDARKANLVLEWQPPYSLDQGLARAALAFRR